MQGIVQVSLKNAPPDAMLWTIALCDWNITTLLHFVGWDGKDLLDIGEEAIFEVPDGVAFPLRIVRLQICKWNAYKTALIELYYVQSYRQYLWDWDKGTWGNEPDPTYRPVFIPALGNYYYNVAEERFEQGPQVSEFIIANFERV